MFEVDKNLDFFVFARCRTLSNVRPYLHTIFIFFLGKQPLDVVGVIDSHKPQTIILSLQPVADECHGSSIKGKWRVRWIS